MKRYTEGIDPKLIGQALASIVGFGVSYFGIELTPEVSAAIALILGVLVGYVFPAPVVKEVPDPGVSERGYTLIEIVVALFVILILLFILLRFLPEDSDAAVLTAGLLGI